jgi:hypothetical protein
MAPLRLSILRLSESSMPRRKLLSWSILGVIVTAAALTALVSLVYHEPAFYRRVYVFPSEQRNIVAEQFFVKFGEMCDHFRDQGFYHKRRDWNYTFTSEQINSYFEEDLQHGNVAEALERHSISSPRLSVEHDRLRLAFQYGSGLWSSVISVDFRIWLVPKEVNVVALEILGRRAGALPISAQFLFNQITELARKRNVDITWYRHNGNPVALLRFQSDRVRPTAQLRRLELRPGMITIGGAPLEVVQQVPNETHAPSPRID